MLIFKLYYCKQQTKNTMKIKILGGLLVALLAITSVAEAQAPAPIKHRVYRQERRIARAEHQGRITPMQADRLRRADHRIARERRMDMARGRYNAATRRHLRRQERRVNHAITRDERFDKVS
jgi:hypothetical protein